jgi:beta-glucosidase
VNPPHRFPSYTTFTLDCKATTAANAATSTNFTFSCDVKNTGTREGDEVVMAFHNVSATIRQQIGSRHPVPLKRLVDFDRVSLAAGASQTLQFSLPRSRLALTTETGDKTVYPGTHQMIFSRGTGADIVLQVPVAAE